MFITVGQKRSRKMEMDFELRLFFQQFLTSRIICQAKCYVSMDEKNLKGETGGKLLFHH